MNYTMEKPAPGGIRWTEKGAEFSVAVPKGMSCTLKLFRSKKKIPYCTIEMKEDILYGDMRLSGVINHVREGDEYLYEVDGKEVIDPYAHLVRKYIKEDEKGRQKEAVRGVLPVCEFDWEGDRPLCIPDEDVIAYSLHVRGFTKNAGSSVKHKGTYIGVTEKIPYLKELGINQIQCMPIYEFEDHIRLSDNYWGYGEAYCFSPKRKYANTDPVKELKQMVKECHLAGIEVIFYLPFFEEMPKQKMIECLRYYRQNYHVDGFIVNPFIVPLEVIQSDAYLTNMKLIIKKDDFQNTMRRFLKSDEGMVDSVIWHLKHLSQKDLTYNYITDHTGFTLADVVSYDGKHNEANGENNQDGPDYNYSWNCGVEGPTRKKAVVKLREKQLRNAFCLLLLSQGTPCILAGDEFANSQNGNNNVYCQDNETAWLNWKKFEKEKWLFHYVKSLIKLRKKYRILHPKRECSGIDRTHCGIPDISYHGENAWQIPNEIFSRQLGILYHSQEETEDGCELYIAYNMHWESHPFALPSLSKEKHWEQIFTTEEREGFLENPICMKEKRNALVAERSIAIFRGVKNDKSEK